jgi:hypothetical protein
MGISFPFWNFFMIKDAIAPAGGSQPARSRPYSQSNHKISSPWKFYESAAAGGSLMGQLLSVLLFCKV